MNHLIVSTTAAGFLFLGTTEAFGLGLYQTGENAEALYRALQVSEQPEKVVSKGEPTNTSEQVYKIGKNVMCIKTLLRVKDEETVSYFCLELPPIKRTG